MRVSFHKRKKEALPLFFDLSCLVLRYLLVIEVTNVICHSLSFTYLPLYVFSSCILSLVSTIYSLSCLFPVPIRSIQWDIINSLLPSDRYGVRIYSQVGCSFTYLLHYTLHLSYFGFCFGGFSLYAIMIGWSAHRIRWKSLILDSCISELTLLLLTDAIIVRLTCVI